jgi:hypothetical protein
MDYGCDEDSDGTTLRLCYHDTRIELKGQNLHGLFHPTQGRQPTPLSAAVPGGGPWVGHLAWGRPRDGDWEH